MNAALDGLMLLLQPTNLLALVAIGLLAGQGAKEFPLAAMAAFTFGIAAASVLIAAALRAQDTVPAWLLTIAALASLAVAIARPVPRVVTINAACLTGALLAFNAPPQATTIPSAIASQIATAVAALATLALVIVIAWRAARLWHHIALRILGSWIAASAILVLAVRFAATR